MLHRLLALYSVLLAHSAWAYGEHPELDWLKQEWVNNAEQATLRIPKIIAELTRLLQENVFNLTSLNLIETYETIANFEENETATGVNCTVNLTNQSDCNVTNCEGNRALVTTSYALNFVPSMVQHTWGALSHGIFGSSPSAETLDSVAENGSSEADAKSDAEPKQPEKIESNGRWKKVFSRAIPIIRQVVDEVQEINQGMLLGNSKMITHGAEAAYREKLFAMLENLYDYSVGVLNQPKTQFGKRAELEEKVIYAPHVEDNRIALLEYENEVVAFYHRVLKKIRTQLAEFYYFNIEYKKEVANRESSERAGIYT